MGKSFILNRFNPQWVGASKGDKRSIRILNLATRLAATNSPNKLKQRIIRNLPQLELPIHFCQRIFSQWKKKVITHISLVVPLLSYLLACPIACLFACVILQLLTICLHIDRIPRKRQKTHNAKKLKKAKKLSFLLAECLVAR